MELALDDFRAIVVLAETLHFGRAADRLHISQPALSKRIRRMEDRVGGPLLLRPYRRLRLTGAGPVLPEPGSPPPPESAATPALPQRAAGGATRAFRIGLPA